MSSKRGKTRQRSGLFAIDGNWQGVVSGVKMDLSTAHVGSVSGLQR